MKPLMSLYVFKSVKDPEAKKVQELLFGFFCSWNFWKKSENNYGSLKIHK